MSINQLNENLCIDVFKEHSTKDSIEKLILYSDIPIPEDYISFISMMSETEILISKQKYIRIWGAQNSLELNEAYMFKEYLPNSLAIGDDEGEYAFVYYNGAHGYGIYAIAFNDLDPDEMFYISPSLEALLVEGDGLTTILSL